MNDNIAANANYLVTFKTKRQKWTKKTPKNISCLDKTKQRDRRKTQASYK